MNGLGAVITAFLLCAPAHGTVTRTGGRIARMLRPLITSILSAQNVQAGAASVATTKDQLTRATSRTDGT